MVERRRLQRRAAMNYHVLSRLALLCCFSLCRTSAMKNPCHPAAHKATPSYGCRKIVLPKNMCTQCNVGAITDRGHYKDCTRTTTTGPACMSKFEEYLAMNPCDTQRKRAYEIFREGEATGNSKMREEGRSMIDYYLYAVCEQSCDCLPLQSSKIHREVEIRRGNCQAHTRYDVCKVLPRIRLIRGEGTPDHNVTNAPDICKDIATWWNSPDRDNWQNRQDHDVAPSVAYFLHRAIQASEMMTSDRVWNACFNLESSQDRISDNHDGWQKVDTDGIPDARHESCFVWHEGKAYLIGGRGRPVVSEYDPRLKKWTNHSSTSARDIHHSQCVSLNGKIWFPNAWFRGLPNEANTAFLATYDPRTQRWDTNTHPALPVQRRRGAGASVVYRGRIYTSHGNSGGQNANSEVLALLDMYNPETKRWRSLPDGAFPRDNTGGAVVRDPDGHDLFCVAGGRESNHGFPNSYGKLVRPTECYNFKSGTWETRPGIPTPRAGAAYGTTCDRKLMVAGGEIKGRNKNAEALNVVEVFDGKKWTKEPSLNHGRHGTGIAFDCSPCGEAHIASGNPTRGGGPDLFSTETFFREGISCKRPLESAPTASPRPLSITPLSAPVGSPTKLENIFSLYISCGPEGRDVIRDGRGRSWVDDRYFQSGMSTVRNTVTSISNAQESNMLDVYRRGRFSETSFAYRIPNLQPGKYRVSLHFAEVGKSPGINKRRFNVNLQSERVLSNYDIFAAAGGANRAIVETFDVLVGNAGFLNINFLKGARSNPFVNGIAIESLFAVEPSSDLLSKHISCGQVEAQIVTDGNGRKWESDRMYVGQGRAFRPTFPANVIGTDATGMNTIYKTQRTHSTKLPYRFDNLPDADYKITLHFMEQVGSLSGIGKRRFHVNIQGKRELTNYDPFQAAGARHKIDRKVFYARPSNRELRIELLKGAADSPIISAIQVEQMPPNFTPPTATEPAPTPAPVPQQILFTVRINAGATESFSANGVRWVADSRFVPSSVAALRSASAREITRLPEFANKEVMRSYRSHPTSWTMTLPRLPPSRVRVTLYFAELETQHFKTGSRVFNVELQGERVLNQFDIFKTAGAGFRTVERVFSIAIGSDGIISLRMVKQGTGGGPILSGLLISSEEPGRRVLVQTNQTDAYLQEADVHEHTLSSIYSDPMMTYY